MPFEDELGKVLQDAGGTFTGDHRVLVTGGLARGRRRVARRRAGIAAGSALAVALVATGGAYLTDGGRTDESAAKFRPSGDYGHFAITAEEIGDILENAMGRTGIGVVKPHVESSGSTDAAEAATASIVFDTGFGEEKVTLSVRRVDPADAAVKALLVCPDAKSSPYEECTNQPGDRAVKGYTEAGKAGGVKKWEVTTLSPNGYLIEAATQNVQVSGSVPPQGSNPRMNPGKLRHLAMFVDGSLTRDGEPNAFGTVVPGSRAEPGDVLPILKYLLPRRLTVYSEGATFGGEGHVVVADGDGNQTYIEATRMAVITMKRAEVLPDGTKVATGSLPGSQPGVVGLQVGVSRVNGLDMIVTAYNAPTPKSRKQGDQPLITLDELKAIALSRTWLTAR
ncbi:hypothetical protein [Streptomyces sp. NPDC059828]|uniref:hypothetical protein n=1 Tax=Streptomyces sp. NPDC059828 TaxID=3346965 RepID=UPI0036652BCD